MTKVPRRPKKAKPDATPPGANGASPPDQPDANGASPPPDQPNAPASPKAPAKATAKNKATAKTRAQANARAKPTARPKANAKRKAKAKAKRPHPADVIEEHLQEPEEGAFLYGLERRIVHPTLVTELVGAEQRIIAVLGEHDSKELWPLYEKLEFEVRWARERSAFGYGFEHGAAQGRAEAFRRQAPGLRKPARQLADQARSLVVNEGLRYRDAAALMLETTWVVLLSKAPPAFDG